jgi:membrane-bound ClpP family serine protease
MLNQTTPHQALKAGRPEARKAGRPERTLFPQRTALVLAVALAWATAARAAEPAVEGHFIAVDTINADVSRQVLHTMDRYVQHFREEKRKPGAGDRVLKLVFDFNARGDRNASPDFGACLKLAEEISRLQDVTTIAFVHGEVSRHTVLAVVACKELVLSQKSVLGPVIGENEPALTQKSPQWAAYRPPPDGYNRTRCPPDVVLKLLDRGMEIVEGRSNQGVVFYLDPRDKEERAEKKIEVLDPNPIVGKGVASYTPALAQKLGLTNSPTRESKEEVANLFRMPPGSVRDELMGRSPSAWKVTVSGGITRAQNESLMRRIRQAVGGRQGRPGANLVILQLECGGGDWSAAVELARFLQTLKDDSGQMKVETVAYIPDRAPDTAAILAFGCSKIVMAEKPVQGQEAPHEAELGDFSVFVPRGQQPTGLQVSALEGLLEAGNYKKILARGLLDRDVVLHEVVRKDNGDWELLTDEEWKEDQAKAKQYDYRRQLKSAGEQLVLKADRAKELRVASDVVDGLPGVYALYDLKPDQVAQAGTDWLDDLAYFLRLPAMTIILFMLGVICLILEMKVPGASFPGVVAAICFVLLFWAHSQLAGQITWLAILLFILGLILIGLEVFVMPGVAVVGLSGAVLVVASLVLVTLEKWPTTTGEWQSVGWTAISFTLSLAGSVVAAFILAWYLPNIPYVNRLILKPAGEDEGELPEEGTTATGQTDYSGLLGAIGTAATPLRPAGKVQFGDQFIDVLAEGNYVEAGTRVQVIEIEGNRIVVKEV